MAKAEFGKVGLIVQLDEFLAKTAEALSKFGDSIAPLVTLGAQGYDAAAARKLAMRAERLTAEDEGPRRPNRCSRRGGSRHLAILGNLARGIPQSAARGPTVAPS